MLSNCIMRPCLLIFVLAHASVALGADGSKEIEVKKAFDKAVQTTTASLNQAAQTQAPAVQPSSSSSSSVSGSAYGPELHTLYKQHNACRLTCIKSEASCHLKFIAARDPKNAPIKGLLLHEAMILSMHHTHTIKPALIEAESFLANKLTKARQTNWNKEKERLTVRGTPDASIQAQEKIVQQYIRQQDLLRDAGPQTPFWILYKSASLDKDSLFLQYEKQLALEVIVSQLAWVCDSIKNKHFDVNALQGTIDHIELLQLPELTPIVEKAKKDLTSLTS